MRAHSGLQQKRGLSIFQIHVSDKQPVAERDPRSGMSDPENQGNTSTGGGEGDLPGFPSERSAAELYP